MRRAGCTKVLAASVLAATLLATPGVATGVAVEGQEQARILPPAGALIDNYTNQGYRLTLHGDEVQVEINTAPLGSTAPFPSPPGLPPSVPRGEDPIRRLARAQTAGASTRYEASGRILGWISRHIAYHLDRGEPQDALTVLERRRGYCTGIARLTVALLDSVGIEAREVAGYVVDEGSSFRQGASPRRGASPRHDSSPRRGYHRWIEIRYPDRGWVFSDPLASHHFVPATYVRLASDQLDIESGLEGLLIERKASLSPIDIFPSASSGIRARRNSARQLAASLRVRVDGATENGEAILAGPTNRYLHPLRDGSAAFVGLEPGLYELQIDLPGQGILRHEIELPDRRAEYFRVRVSAPSKEEAHR